MGFESFNPRSEPEKKPIKPNVFDNQVKTGMKTGILLGLSAAAAIAMSCTKEKPATDIGLDEKVTTAETEEAKAEVESPEALPTNKYIVNLGESLNKYLQKISGGAAREKKKEEMLARIDRAEKIVWQERFNGNYNGQKAYFGQVIESPIRRVQVAEVVAKSVSESGLPKQFIEGIIGAESGGRQFRIDSAGNEQRLGSNKGAVGLMGVTPIAGVESGVFTRAELFSHDKDGKEFFDQKKNNELVKRLAEDVELNRRVGIGELAFLAERYNGDLGLVAASYSGGMVDVEQKLVKVYNKQLQKEYLAKLLEQKGKKKKHFVPPPKLETRGSIVEKKGGMAQFLAETGISIFDLVDDGKSYYPTNTYPFEVMVLGPMLDEILQSKSNPADTTKLVSDETVASWKTVAKTKIAKK